MVNFRQQFIAKWVEHVQAQRSFALTLRNPWTHSEAAFYTGKSEVHRDLYIFNPLYSDGLFHPYLLEESIAIKGVLGVIFLGLIASRKNCC